jgi:hypothetical protein
MRDPQTVAFEIHYPWWRQSIILAPGGKPHRYYDSFITIWHVDPETDGTDDSCGWFMRARHGDKKVLERIEAAFRFDWDPKYGGWFAQNGEPMMSIQAIALSMFWRAALEHFGNNREKTQRFMQRNLFDILFFAENAFDSMADGIRGRYGPSPREERITSSAGMVYSWILRAERPWYRSPRWHIHHWKLQVHPLQNFKRWAFSRCCKCGKGFGWGASVCSNSWHGAGPQWFRSEPGVYHGDCRNPKSDGLAQEAKAEVSR